MSKDKVTYNQIKNINFNTDATDLVLKEISGKFDSPFFSATTKPNIKEYENDDLNAKIELLKSKKTRLGEILKSGKEGKEGKEVEGEKNKEENPYSKKDLDNIKKQIKKLKAQSLDIKGKKSALEARETAISANIRKDIEELEKELDTKAENTNIRKLESQVTDLNKDKSTLEGDLSKLNKNIEGQIKALLESGKKEESASSDKKGIKLSDNITALERLKNETKTTLNNKRSEFKEREKTLNTNIRVLENNLSDLGKQESALPVRKEALNKEGLALEGREGDLNRDISNQIKELLKFLNREAELASLNGKNLSYKINALKELKNRAKTDLKNTQKIALSRRELELNNNIRISEEKLSDLNKQESELLKEEKKRREVLKLITNKEDINIKTLEQTLSQYQINFPEGVNVSTLEKILNKYIPAEKGKAGSSGEKNPLSKILNKVGLLNELSKELLKDVNSRKEALRNNKEEELKTLGGLKTSKAVDLNNEKLELDNYTKTINTDIKVLENSLSAIDEQRSLLQERRKELEEDELELPETRRLLNNNIKNQISQLLESEKEGKSEPEKKEELELDKKSTSELVETLKNEKTRILDNKRSAFTLKETTLKTNIEGLTTILSALNTQQSSLTSRETTLKTNIEELKSRLSALDTNIKANLKLEEKKGDKPAPSDKKEENLATKIDELKEQAKSLLTNIGFLKEDLPKPEEKKGDKPAPSGKKDAKSEEKELTLDVLKNKLSTLNKNIKDLTGIKTNIAKLEPSLPASEVGKSEPEKKKEEDEIKQLEEKLKNFQKIRIIDYQLQNNLFHLDKPSDELSVQDSEKKDITIVDANARYLERPANPNNFANLTDDVANLDQAGGSLTYDKMVEYINEYYLAFSVDEELDGGRRVLKRTKLNYIIDSNQKRYSKMKRFLDKVLEIPINKDPSYRPNILEKNFSRREYIEAKIKDSDIQKAYRETLFYYQFYEKVTSLSLNKPGVKSFFRFRNEEGESFIIKKNTGNGFTIISSYSTEGDIKKQPWYKFLENEGKRRKENASYSVAVKNKVENKNETIFGAFFNEKKLNENPGGVDISTFPDILDQGLKSSLIEMVYPSLSNIYTDQTFTTKIKSLLLSSKKIKELEDQIKGDDGSLNEYQISQRVTERIEKEIETKINEIREKVKKTVKDKDISEEKKDKLIKNKITDSENENIEALISETLDKQFEGKKINIVEKVEEEIEDAKVRQNSQYERFVVDDDKKYAIYKLTDKTDDQGIRLSISNPKKTKDTKKISYVVKKIEEIQKEAIKRTKKRLAEVGVDDKFLDDYEFIEFYSKFSKENNGFSSTSMEVGQRRDEIGKKQKKFADEIKTIDKYKNLPEQNLTYMAQSARLLSKKFQEVAKEKNILTGRVKRINSEDNIKSGFRYSRVPKALTHYVVNSPYEKNSSKYNKKSFGIFGRKVNNKNNNKNNPTSVFM